MKKLIIYLFSILLSGSMQMITAQESKYFEIKNNDQSIVCLVPKHLKPGLQERKKGNNNWGFVVTNYNMNYFNTFMPIYKEVFGIDYKYNGDRRNLICINCTFWFGEDLKPYYYQINFPTNMLDEFPLWEEKLYQLCERSMKVDLRSFINVPEDKSNFEWSNFSVNFRNLYLFSEGRLRLDYY